MIGAERNAGGASVDASGLSSLTRDVREAALSLLQLLVRQCIQPQAVSQTREMGATAAAAAGARRAPDRRRLRDLWAALFTYSPTAAAAAALPLGALGLHQPPRHPLQSSCLALSALNFVLKLGSHTVRPLPRSSYLKIILV